MYTVTQVTTVEKHFTGRPLPEGDVELVECDAAGVADPSTVVFGIVTLDGDGDLVAIPAA